VITLLVLVLVLALVGYAITLIPMDPKFRSLIFVVIAVIVIIYLIGLVAGWPLMQPRAW
jgi:predicted membrane channel-forming protein YqfA (hemolysin III family)